MECVNDTLTFAVSGTRAKNCARLDWSVLKVCALYFRGMRTLRGYSFVPMPFFQWNKPSIDFYELGLGAKPMSEWMGMRLEEQGIDNLKKFTPGGRDLA